MALLREMKLGKSPVLYEEQNGPRMRAVRESVKIQYWIFAFPFQGSSQCVNFLILAAVSTHAPPAAIPKMAWALTGLLRNPSNWTTACLLHLSLTTAVLLLESVQFANTENADWWESTQCLTLVERWVWSCKTSVSLRCSEQNGSWGRTMLLLCPAAIAAVELLTLRAIQLCIFCGALTVVYEKGNVFHNLWMKFFLEVLFLGLQSL